MRTFEYEEGVDGIRLVWIGDGQWEVWVKRGERTLFLDADERKKQGRTKVLRPADTDYRPDRINGEVRVVNAPANADFSYLRG